MNGRVSLERKRPVGVVYLAWHALGLDMFKRFADSYRRYAAGCEHDLIVIYAGFQKQNELNDAVAAFHDLPHIKLVFTDVRLDIGYYLGAARCVDNEFLCFLNTYTEITTPNWLAYFYTHASREGVGIVGATGSYESLSDSFGLYQKLIWVIGVSGNRIPERVAYYFHFILGFNCPTAVVDPPVPRLPSGIARWKRGITQYMTECEQDVDFCDHWRMLTSPNMVFADFLRFPAFPNPHVRSSGFMVRRESLLVFEPSQIKTKLDACAFESGLDSLTSQIRRKGLAALVVTNDGRGYDVPDWSRSNTFRLGDEQKLILLDNRSGEFLHMSAGERITHVRITWGDYLQRAPADFPNFGYKFAKGRLDAQSAPTIQSRSLASNPLYLSCKMAMRLVELKRRSEVYVVSNARSAVRQTLFAILPSRLRRKGACKK